jgi:hypothetical protein
MGTKGSEVQKYAKANKLDLNDKYDLAKVIHFYNSFFEKK